MRRILAAVTVGMVAIGCVGPSRTAADYREKAANTAEAMISTVETARLATRAGLDGKAFSRYLSLVLSESETDASSISESFKAVQPPGGADVDRLRTELGSLLDESTAALADLRVAAYRDDRSALAAGVRRLPDLRGRLERYRSLAAT